MQQKNKVLRLANHPFRFGIFLFYKLPAAFFSGIKIKECTEQKCVTSVPYGWLTQNPFRSTYFASLSMAAEMSTGILALSNTYKKQPSVSLLVVRMEAHYFKKATGTTFFSCIEGFEIANAVNEAVSSGAGKTITAKSAGKNKNGEMIAEFLFTWSFKVKGIRIANITGTSG